MKIEVTKEALSALINDQKQHGTSLFRILSGCAACGGLSFGLAPETQITNEDLSEQHGQLTLVYSTEVADYLDNAKLDHHIDSYGSHYIIESSYGSSACWLDD